MTRTLGQSAVAGNATGPIQAAALELFARLSYQATTVEMVADQAGVSERTLFRYFETSRLRDFETSRLRDFETSRAKMI